MNTQADIYYTVDLSGAWTVNGVAVEEGSELAQKLTGDNFSGTYISTYLEEDSGNYADNSCRLDIKMTTDGNTPPLFYLTEYYKKSDGSWEKITVRLKELQARVWTKMEIRFLFVVMMKRTPAQEL